MAEGRPVFVTDFSMDAAPALLDRISYSNAASYPFREDYLQWLLDTTPQVLPIRDFFPTVLSLCSLGREIPVDLGRKEGYIDNLFVTNDARLVLVEAKLYRNPEGIREVVAQTYQYEEAINGMTYMRFEAALRKGQKAGNELRATETIAARVQAKEASGEMIGIVDDFEDQLATNMRRGEVLYLIVADGIHASVERMAFWLNELSGSAPHRFGLIELRSYVTANGSAVVVPRALVKTKEISRHVVVIESRSPDMAVAATVEDRTGTEGGAVSISSRAVSTRGPSLTKDRLFEQLRSRSQRAYETAAALVAGFEAAAFDSRALATELQYGLTYPPGEGDLSPLVSLTANGVMSYLRVKVIAAIGPAEFSAYKARLNAVAPFYLKDEIHDPKKLFGHTQHYEKLEGKADDIVRALVDTRAVAMEALMQPKEQA